MESKSIKCEKMQRHQVIARKYRPKNFYEVIGQDSVIKTLQNALRYNLSAHAYLFCGPKGVGKTTIARIYAKALNCENLTDKFEPCNTCSSCKEISSGNSLDVIEIDGASNRGIDDIRQINDTVSYSPSNGNYKIYIIDEVHMLTKEAFNALLKTLEEPPEKTKFFFATTEAHKVLSTILSRCQRFDLKRVSNNEIIKKLTKIISSLKREVENEALQIIANFSDGSMRDAESILEQILCYEDDIITAKTVQDALGLIPKDRFFELDNAMHQQDILCAFSIVNEVFERGIDTSYFLEELIEHYRNILVVLLNPNANHSIRYFENAKLYNLDQLQFILDYLMQMGKYLSTSSFKKVTLEMIVMKVIQSKTNSSLSDLFKRLLALEDRLKNSFSDQKNTTLNIFDENKSLENADVTLPPIEKQIHSVEKKTETEPSDKIELTDLEFQLDKKKPSDTQSFSDYETVMRFAAVELEGSLKIEKKEI
jgi:DNA polymerase III subunit gamma/tau